MTVRSLTSFAKSASNFLAARDANRQEAVARALCARRPCGSFESRFPVAQRSGCGQSPPGVEGLFLALHHALLTALPQALEIERAVDALGPYALYRVPCAGRCRETCLHRHRKCAAFPSFSRPRRLCRRAEPHQIGRRALDGLKLPVVPESRRRVHAPGSHPFQDLLDRVHELLTPFRT